MDPVDQLTMAVQAAQALRTAEEPETVLAGAYGTIGRRPPEDADEPMAVRVARLVTEAGEQRRELMDYLEAHARGPYLNRPAGGWGEAGAEDKIEENPEAVRLLEMVDEEEAEGREMFPEGFPPFCIARRSVSGFFGGRTVIVRGGKRLTSEEAGDLQAGDSISHQNEGLPVSVRGLIDYPLETPVLFPIEVGGEPWSLWDVCCAFADQYVKIYEASRRHGVWGHDLTDLWIESLVYYPEEQLIYAVIGS